jgi:Ca-activated chloride channel homolog
MYKIILLVCIPVIMYAQSARSLINDGVDLYKKENYVDAEVKFRKGIEKTPESFEANFNLGDAYYKQQKYDEAVNSFHNALKFTESKDNKAKVYHNIGNSLLKSNQLKESIEAYKSSLRLNPDDQDTKYNLSYALQMLEQQQQNKDQQKDDKNKDDNKDQDKQQQDNGQNEQKDQDKQQQDQQQQNQSPEDQKAQQDKLKQQDKDNMSKEEAEQILNALKNNEQDLQKKLRQKTGIKVNTEKDW